MPEEPEGRPGRRAGEDDAVRDYSGDRGPVPGGRPPASARTVLADVAIIVIALGVIAVLVLLVYLVVASLT